MFAEFHPKRENLYFAQRSGAKNEGLFIPLMSNSDHKIKFVSRPLLQGTLSA
jgi:hypothetical protein